MAKINVKGTEVTIIKIDDVDYISLTDIAKVKNHDDANGVIANWMRNRNTIEYLGIWEELHNPGFNPLEFEGFWEASGSNAFTLSPLKWIRSTNACGMYVRTGRGGGTFAHKDIAFKFASWISAEFELYIIKDYQRLKEDENSRISLGWNVNRILAKVNYRIHTNAIKNSLMPTALTTRQQSPAYASEADLLNVVLFGKTAAEWRAANPGKDGNIRDHATIEQLLVLANLENINAMLIDNGMAQHERVVKLGRLAYSQMESVLNTGSVKQMKALGNNGSKGKR